MSVMDSMIEVITPFICTMIRYRCLWVQLLRGWALSNSQCTIYGTAGTGQISSTATDLTVNIRIGLTGSFALTTQTVYLWIVDNLWAGTGWVATSSWPLAAPQPPAVISGTPTATNVSPQTFTFTGRDPNGATDMGRMYFLVNSSPTIPQNVCHGFYDRPSNGLYLYNDSITVLMGPLTPGSSGSLQNTHCTIYGTGSALVSAAGTDLVVNIRIGLTGLFSLKTQKVYLWIVDNAQTGTGWVQTSTWTSSVPSIAPSSFEINLSAVPLDQYNTPGSGGLIFGCTANTVRLCVQQLFQSNPYNYRAQGVTGVRFFFTLAGGYHSTPFDAAGNVNPVWSQNIYDFFSDLKLYGITKVTPTPVFDTWSGPVSMMQAISATSCGEPVTLNFVPWLPYGLDLTENYPDRSCGNQSYSQAAHNPIFWGWTRFFNLMNTVLSRAAQAQLSVNALDYYQETNMADFTVMARFIYDFYPPGAGTSVDVLTELRNRMTSNGFSAGRIAPSANGPAKPTPASANCTNWYGDSALLETLTAQTAAIAGPWSKFGVPPFHSEFDYSLKCYNPATDPAEDETMPSIPVWHSQPTFTDMHSQKMYATDADTTTFSNSFHSLLWTFLVNRGLSGNDVVFGETNPVNCDGWTSTAAAAMITGYKSSTLYANAGARVTMRPWHRTETGSACVSSPHVINPPFNPFAP